MTKYEVVNYLKRIGLPSSQPTLEGLTQLQEHHLEHIPFENLDIVVRRNISLDYQHLYTKLITKQRGGYCFELNTLYAALLTALGFLPRPVLARVWLSNPKLTPPRNHLAYLVDLDDSTYLVDVGFGGLVASVLLDINSIEQVNDKYGTMRVLPDADYDFMIQRKTDQGWDNLYSFAAHIVSLQEIIIANQYMSTNTNSHFYYHKFVGKNTPMGRIALFNNKFSTRNGIKISSKCKVAYGQAWLDIIEKEFGLTLHFSNEEFELLFKSYVD